MSDVPRILEWLTVARPHRKTSMKRSLAATAIVTLIGLALSAPYLKIPPDAAPRDGHSLFSLDLAINWIHCGKYAMHSVTYDLTQYFFKHSDEVRHLPMSAVLEKAAGSKDAYCSTVNQPFLNNENTLFYIFSALLRIHPDVTLAGLGVLLTWIRVASLVFFVFALLSVGASPLFSLLVLMLSLEISGLLARPYLYSMYPFFLPFVAVYAGLLALTLHLDLHRKNRNLALAAVVIGLFGGFFYNLRTSYAPAVVGCYLLFVFLVFSDTARSGLPPASGRWKAAGVALAGFLAGGALFYLVFTFPLTRSGVTYNRSYHVVAHSVVLGVSLPQNELSNTEGIRWSDTVGLDLARRVDPNVSYLGPTYESALATYYWGLWRRHPRQMLGIYLTKWRLSTTDVVTFVNADMSPLAKRIIGPTRYVTSGIVFTILFIAITIAAVFLGRKYSPGAGILVATLAGTGFFVSLESAIVVPFFYLQYHNAQVLILLLINLVFFQMLVNAAFRLFTGRSSARAAGPFVSRNAAIAASEPTATHARPKPRVSIVTTFHNEASALSERLRSIVSTTDALKHLYDFEFVFVDDGSRDDSPRRARDLAAFEPRLRVIELRRNYGQTAALQAGVDAATGSVIVTMDADLRHSPDELPAFLEKIDQGSDVVCGRRQQGEEKSSRRWLFLAANDLLRRVAGLSIDDLGTTDCAYRREILADMSLLGESHRYAMVYARAVGATIGEIPIRNVQPPAAPSLDDVWQIIDVVMDSFFIFFSVRFLDRPIRIFGRIALAAFGFGSVIAGMLFVTWLGDGVPGVRAQSGWFILSVVSLLASVQFLVAGIIGEMVARMYFSSNRPTTYKARKIRSEDALA